MFDEPDDEVIVLACADHRDARVIGKNDRNRRCRVFGAAIAWRIGAGAVGSVVIARRWRRIGIRAGLGEEVVDLANHTGCCVGAINDHGVVDGDLLGENFLTRPDAAVFGQNVFQVRPSDQVRHAGEGRQLVLTRQLGLGCAVEVGHLRAKVDGFFGHVRNQGGCVFARRCARDGIHADRETFVVTAEKKLDIAQDLDHALAVDAHSFEGLPVAQDAVIGFDRALDVVEAGVEFGLCIYLCDLDGGVIDDRQFLLFQQRVDDRNGTGLHGHRDSGVESQYVFRHGRLKADGSEQERQRFGHRHFANGEGDFRIVQHLLQKRCLGTDHAVFATDENQVIGKFEIAVAAAGEVASEDRKHGRAEAADCLAQAVLDVGIDIAQGGEDQVLELKTLGNEDLRARKRPLIDDRLPFILGKLFDFGAG